MIASKEIKENPWIYFLVVVMAGGIARGRVCTTTESRKMAAIIQLWCIASYFVTGHQCYGQLTPVKSVSADQYQGLKFIAFWGHVFLKWAANQVLVFIGSRAQVWWARCNQGRVARKRVDANPRLKINRIIDFSRIQMFFTAFVLCVLRLFKT